jgi:hypothetical protein
MGYIEFFWGKKGGFQKYVWPEQSDIPFPTESDKPHAMGQRRIRL